MVFKYRCGRVRIARTMDILLSFSTACIFIPSPKSIRWPPLESQNLAGTRTTGPVCMLCTFVGCLHTLRGVTDPTDGAVAQLTFLMGIAGDESMLTHGEVKSLQQWRWFSVCFGLLLFLATVWTYVPVTKTELMDGELQHTLMGVIHVICIICVGVSALFVLPGWLVAFQLSAALVGHRVSTKFGTILQMQRGSMCESRTDTSWSRSEIWFASRCQRAGLCRYFLQGTAAR